MAEQIIEEILDQHVKEKHDFQKQIERIEIKQKFFMILVGFLNNALQYTIVNLLSILFEDFTDPEIQEQRKYVSTYFLLFNFLANIINLFYFQRVSQKAKLRLVVVCNLLGATSVLVGIKKLNKNFYFLGSSFVGLGQTFGVICLNYYFKVICKDVAISMNHGFTISSLFVTVFLRFFMVTKEQPENLLRKETIFYILMFLSLVYYFINIQLKKSVAQIQKIKAEWHLSIENFAKQVLIEEETNTENQEQKNEIKENYLQTEKRQSKSILQVTKEIIKGAIHIKYYTINIMVVYMLAYAIILYMTKKYLLEVAKPKNNDTAQQNTLICYYFGLMLGRMSIDFIKIRSIVTLQLFILTTHVFYIYIIIEKIVIELYQQYLIIFIMSIFAGLVQVNTQYHLISDFQLIKHRKEFYSLILNLANCFGSFLNSVLIEIYNNFLFKKH